jgi:hypothetical protein
MKGCNLRMYGTLVAEVEDSGDNELNPDLKFRKYFFMTALAGEHSKDTSDILKAHDILK